MRYDSSLPRGAAFEQLAEPFAVSYACIQILSRPLCLGTACARKSRKTASETEMLTLATGRSA